MNKHIFVCYARENIETALAVETHFEEAGHTVFVDMHDLIGGDSWRERIVANIERADVVVILLSRESIESPEVERELNIASGERTEIIPVRLDATPLSRVTKHTLAGLQFIDATDKHQDWMSALEVAVDPSTTVTPMNDDSPSRPWVIMASILAAVLLAGTVAFVFANREGPGTLDDTLIAYTSNIGDSAKTVVMGADGSNPTQLVQSPHPEEQASWSPDGTRIAFSSPGSASTWDVYVMDADGSSSTRLTAGAGDKGSPSWSPGGSLITFASDRDGDSQIYAMDADGSNTVRLTTSPENGFAPAWSPDGTRIAFASTRDGNTEIYVMGTDGSNPTRLTESPEHDFNPAWSPDSSKIAFTSMLDPDIDIYVMDADGSNPTRLTESPGDDSDPSWSPDGAKIAFTSTRDGNHEIYLMDADGTNQSRLTDNPLSDRWPAWSPFLGLTAPADSAE